MPGQACPFGVPERALLPSLATALDEAALAGCIATLMAKRRRETAHPASLATTSAGS